ncbi:MAG: hypothetical protein DSZ03_02595 [Sulfurimonas sp.]|nr:MAG: hypothetical protein DSZ03_02595 [Sulfurimonas sp.]
MRLSISQQNIYLLVFSVLLLVFVLFFAFFALIPEGKNYRIERLEMKKYEANELQYHQWHDEVLEELQTLRSQHQHTIAAYDNTFNPERFVKMNSVYFESLKLQQLSPKEDEEGFSVYEVNATTKIDSPSSFYAFLEGINKGDWVINVNFPIRFEREGNVIRSTFTLKIYANLQEK